MPMTDTEIVTAFKILSDKIVLLQNGHNTQLQQIAAANKRIEAEIAQRERLEAELKRIIPTL